LRLADRMINRSKRCRISRIRIGHLAESSLVRVPCRRDASDRGRLIRISEAGGRPRRRRRIASHQTIQFGATAVSPDWHFVEDGREVRVRAPRARHQSADAAIQYAEQGGG